MLDLSHNLCALVKRVALGDFLPILGEPVTLAVELLELEAFLNQRVDQRLFLVCELPNKFVVVLCAG
jgi:hypothetical protein